MHTTECVSLKNTSSVEKLVDFTYTTAIQIFEEAKRNKKLSCIIITFYPDESQVCIGRGAINTYIECKCDSDFQKRLKRICMKNSNLRVVYFEENHISMAQIIIMQEKNSLG